MQPESRENFAFSTGLAAAGVATHYLFQVTGWAAVAHLAGALLWPTYAAGFVTLGWLRGLDLEPALISRGIIAAAFTWGYYFGFVALLRRWHNLSRSRLFVATILLHSLLALVGAVYFGIVLRIGRDLVHIT
jgi:hypothetical protein